MKLQGTKKSQRVWAAYLLQGDPVDVLRRVQESLDPEKYDYNSAYFGLSEEHGVGEGEESGQCEGSHYSDGEVTVYLEPVTMTTGASAMQLLILVGCADGLKLPGITPPSIGEEEAFDWGSKKAPLLEVLWHAHKWALKTLKKGEVKPIVTKEARNA